MKSETIIVIGIIVGISLTVIAVFVETVYLLKKFNLI